MPEPIDILRPLRLNYGPKNYFELGYKDPILPKGRWRFAYTNIKEFDPLYYDPPITNSKVSVRTGGDSCHDPCEELAFKYMGMPMDEWRYKVLYRQNPTIKNIHDNWDISPEHPGMAFRNGLRSTFNELRYQGNMFGLGEWWFKRLAPGGRYFDDPEGEQCFRKAWACSKVALLGTAPVFLYDISSISMPEGVKNRVKLFFRMAYLPVLSAYAWGAFSCLACSIRQQDDLINYSWGSIAAGTVIGFRLGYANGMRIGFIINGITWIWRVIKDSYEGPYGKAEMFNTDFGGPASWKWSYVPGFRNYHPQRDY